MRFPTLGLQSYWGDESATYRVLNGSATHVWRLVESQEDTPPLYYYLAWAWTHVFGTSEVALRSLSALFGTGVVAAVYAAGRLLAGNRVGLVAALLAATSPYLVWYSQDARSYALFVVLTTAALALCVRYLRSPDTRTLAAWATVSGLALWTHYFALFAVAGQAAVLLWLGARRRAVAAVTAAVGVAALLVLPLLLHQEAKHHVPWLDTLSLPYRLRETAMVFALGTGFHSGLPRAALVACSLCFLVIAAGCCVAGFLLVRRADRAERRAAEIAGVVAGVAILLPLILSALGHDYVFHRNLIAALPALELVGAAGLAARRAGNLGVAAAAAVAAAGVAVVATTDATPAMQRTNFRGVARLLGPAQRDRVIVIGPRWAFGTLSIYQHGLVSLPGAGLAVSEVDFLSPSGRIPPRPLRPPFRLVSTRRVDPLTMVRFRAPSPVRVGPAELERPFYGSEEPKVVFQRARSR